MEVTVVVTVPVSDIKYEKLVDNNVKSLNLTLKGNTCIAQLIEPGIPTIRFVLDSNDLIQALKHLHSNTQLIEG
jgi:hypothetical protein